MQKRVIILEATDACDPQRRGIGMQMRAWYEAASYNNFPQIDFIVAARHMTQSEPLNIKAANVRQATIKAESQTDYVDELHKLGGGLLFVPWADTSYWRQSGTKLVGIDYGMEDLCCRDYIAPRSAQEHLDWHTRAFDKFDGIITVSQTSKKDLAWFFPEHKHKIEVIYPGAVQQTLVGEQLPDILTAGNFYFIMGYERKKNIERIATAFDRFKRETGSTAKLAIAGKPGYGAGTIDRHIATLNSVNEIIKLGYISEELKQTLLQQCRALVALPIYEGFGLSALEALAAGKITLVSDNGSLAEVVGNAGVTADPFSISDMAIKFTQIDQLQSNPYKQHISARLQTFDTATQANKLLRQLMSVL